MSMKNASASQKTMLSRILTALFGTATKVSADIPTIPNIYYHYGSGEQGYNFRSTQKQRRKMERRVGHA